MGGSSSKPNLGPKPAAPTPIDYSSLMNSANAASANAYQQQLADQNNAYPQIQALQLGTINSLADTIGGNDLNKQSVAAIQQGLGYVPYIANQAGYVNQAAGNVGAQAGNLSSLAGQLEGYGTAALASSGPTAGETTLLNQTGSDLALGSALNPEEERAANQQAVSAFAHSGLGTGQSAAAADLLNRYAVGQARLQQRQSAFTNADTAVNQNVLARTNSALGALGQAGSNYGNAGSLYNNQGNLYGLGANIYSNAASTAFQGGSALNAVNPLTQALGYGAQLSGQALGNTSGMLTNAYNQALNTAGDVASYNTNMQSSLYNSYNNNQSALSGAQSASNSALLGAGLGALGTIGGAVIGGPVGAAAGGAIFGPAGQAGMKSWFCWVAREVYGEQNPAWLQFRQWMLSFGSDRRVAKYIEHGPKIAKYIATRPGWKAKIQRWMDAKRAQLLSIQTLHAA